jgi:hypothetical protein
MAGTARQLFVAAVLVVVSGGVVHGQEAGPFPAPRPVLPDEASTAAPEASPLPTRSAFALPPHRDIPYPSFAERDPLLEEPGTYPPPGWYGDVEVEVVGAHFKDRLVDVFTFSRTRSDRIHPAPAELDWTASPRFEAGYRLPHNFGEFLVSYRFLVTQGEQTLGPDALQSRLDVNEADFDYAKRDFLPALGLDVRWRVGLRVAAMFWDTHANRPVSTVGPSMAFEQGTSDFIKGAGPVGGLEVARAFGIPGLAFYGDFDFASVWEHLDQEFEETLAPGPAGGGPMLVRLHHPATQATLVVGTQLGFRWVPPGYESTRLFVGYEFKQWWQVGRNENTGSVGNLTEHGIFVRGELTF